LSPNSNTNSKLNRVYSEARPVWKQWQ